MRSATQLRALLVTLALLAFSSFDAVAQVPQLTTGSRARIKAAGLGTMIGTVMKQGADTISLAESGAVIRHIPVPGVRDIRISQGRSHSAGAIKGAKIGANISGSLWVLAAILSGGDVDILSSGFVVYTAMVASSGALWGAGIGALVGAEKWNRVYPGKRSPRLSVRRAPQDIGVGFSLAF